MTTLMIFSGSDLYSAHRINMNASMFKLFGKTIVSAMTIRFLESNYVTQSWWVQFWEFTQYSFDHFNGPALRGRAFFRQTPVSHVAAAIRGRGLASSSMRTLAEIIAERPSVRPIICVRPADTATL